MLEQFLSLLGKPFVLPATFLLIGAWTINKISALHDSRRRNRIEFLERWRTVDDMDDMRLEVTIRHLVGTYLAADIIRTISRGPFPTQSLIDLAAVWPLTHFDLLNRHLSWKKQEYGDPAALRWLRAIMMLGYVVFALIAVFFFYLAVGTDPSRPTAWISGLNTLMFIVLAGSCLARFDTLGYVGKHGAALLNRINSAMSKQCT